MIKTVLLVGLSLFPIVASAVSPQEFCITNNDDFEKNKSKLPAVFQKLPVTFVYHKDNVLGAVSLRKGDKGFLKLEGGGCKKMLVTMCDWDPDTDIKELCYQGGNYRIALATGAEFKGRVNGNTVRISDYDFKVAKPSEYVAMVQEMGKKTVIPANSIAPGGQQ